MNEPVVLAQTGLTVAEHQRLTVENYLTLCTMAADLPFVPVLQGWDHEDYLRCADLYDAAGVDLAAEPVVGVGTVCRRQDTGFARQLMTDLHGMGLALHGFGIKGGGLSYRDKMTSYDSMAWSFRARRDAGDREKRGLPRTRYGCSHASCANCIRFALDWRDDLLMKTPQP